jgi:hypothetical protein
MFPFFAELFTSEQSQKWESLHTIMGTYASFCSKQDRERAEEILRFNLHILDMSAKGEEEVSVS